MNTDSNATYIVIKDKAEDNATPDTTYEINGPNILEAGTQYYLAYDRFRRTEITEANATRVKVVVRGNFVASNGTTYRLDAGNDHPITVTEEYTFTPDGMYVSNVTNFQDDGLALDNTNPQDGYNWLMLEGDVTDAAFGGTIYYGARSGASDSSTSADATFEDSNPYVVFGGSGSYQSAIVAVSKWFNMDGGTDDFRFDADYSGSLDLLHARERGTTPSLFHRANWFFSLQPQADVDTAAERQGFVNDLINADTPTISAGEYWDDQPGSALLFDGTSDYVNIPHNAGLNVTSGFTLSAWINPSDGYESDGIWRAIVAKGNANAENFFMTMYEDEIECGFYASSGYRSITTSQNVIVVGSWMHISCTYSDSNNRFRVYKNGVLQSETSTIYTPSTSSTPVLIGNDAYNEWFPGIIDDVRIYNKELTESEIRLGMYNHEDETSLVGHWKLDDDLGQSVIDSSPTGADGTLGASSAASTDDPLWTVGIVPKRQLASDGAYSLSFSNGNESVFTIDGGNNVANTLSSGISAGATSIPLTSSASFSTTGFGYVDADKFTYTGNSANSLTGVPSSGDFGVEAHASGAVVSTSYRHWPQYKINRWRNLNLPSNVLKNGSIMGSTEYNLSKKSFSTATFDQDITFYSPIDSTAINIGSSATLTNNGSVLFTDGINGLGAFITGTGDSLSFTNSGDISYAQGAIEFWARPEWASNDGADHIFISAGNPLTEPADYMVLRKGSGNSLVWLFYDWGTGTYYQTSISSANYSWAPGDWIHFRLTWDESASTSEQFRIFINGKEPTNTDSGGDYSSSVFSPSSTILIGNSPNPGYACDCTMDDLYIYSSVSAPQNLSAGGDTASTDEYLADDTNNKTLNFTAIDAQNRGEYFYLGSDSRFNGVNSTLATAGVGTADIEWEYWNGTTWGSLTMIDKENGASDFKASGSFYFNIPGDWLLYSYHDSTPQYYIRGYLNSGSYTTIPIESTIYTDILTLQILDDIKTSDTTISLNVSGKDTSSGGPPISFWAMDEGYGSTVNDMDGVNDNDLTLSGATWNVRSGSGKSGYLSFDGSNDQLYRINDGDFNFDTGSFTITGSFRHPTTISGTDTLLARFSTAGYKIYMNSSGYLCFAIDGDSTWTPADSACTTTSYADSSWHTFSAIKNSTSSIQLYIDGKKVAEDASLTANGSLDTYATFYLGIDSDGSSNPWLGDLDNVSIYNYARSEAQLKQDAIGPQTAVSFGADQNIDSLTSGLVGWWKLEETATPSLDSSGNGNSGTWGGNTATASGKFGNGVTMDGNGDYITVSGLTITPSEFTVSFWLNPTTLADSNQNILATNSWGAFVFHTTATGGVYVGTDLSGRLTPTELPAGTLTTGSWQHFTFTYKAGKGSFYKNGNLLASKTGLQNPSAWGGFSIGANSVNSINGQVDEVRVYTRQLSEGDVKKLYNFAPSPVVYFDLNENTGTSSVYDKSGNGLSGSMNGTMTQSDWVPGKLGSALDFDGSNDYIGVSDTSILDITGPITVSTWIKYNSVPASGYYKIVGKWNETGNQRSFALTHTNTSWQFYAVSVGTGAPGCTVTSSTSPSAGTWYYLTGVYDGSNCHLYVNSVSNATPVAYSSGIYSGSAALNIGGSGSEPIGGQNNYLNAVIDQIQIYNYARTQSQIIEDMNGGHPVGGSPIGSQVGYWKLDEGYGTTANDSSPLVNNLTLSTASWVTSGKFNNAFNGEGSRWLSRADDADLDFNATDSFAISGWFRSDSASNPGATEYLVTKSNATTAGYAMYINTSGQACIGIDDDTSWGPDIASCSSADIYDANWHHILGMRDVTADQTKLFIDGVLVDSDTDPTTATLENSLTFYVGDRDGSNNGNEFVGDIDELKVYRTALTDEQVKTEYLAGKTTKLGSLSTNSSGVSNDSKDRSYCIPGDSTSCSAPILEWKYDENTGTSANDTSGSGFTGSFGSAPAWIKGKEGSALNFDGADDYVSVASSASITDLAALTYEAWIYPTGWGEGNFGRIIDKDDSFNTRNMFVLLNNTGQQSFRFYRGRATTDTYADAADGSITLNQWQHVAVSYDSSSFVRLYLNGREVTSYTQQTVGSGSLTTESGVPLVVGNRQGQDRSFQGIIDQVRVFNYARTANQIAWSYNQGAPVAWYKFDECSGATINNSAPSATGGDSGLDGTLSLGASGTTSAGTCTTSGAWYNGVVGKLSSSMDFDGTDDYVSISDDDSLSFGNTTTDRPFTIASWVYLDDATNFTIFAKGSDTAGEYILRTDSGDKLELDLCEDSCATFTGLETTTTLTSKEGSWVHVAATYDGSGARAGINLYFDGVAQPENNQGNTSITAMNNQAQSAVIGRYFNNGANYANGRIDDLRIYGYVLTTQQIKEVMNTGAVSFR